MCPILLLPLLRLCGFGAQALACMSYGSHNLADDTVLLWVLPSSTKLFVLLCA